MNRHFQPNLEIIEARITLSTLAPRFNRSNFPAERQSISDGSQGSFPYLGQNYQVLAPSSGTYNCISYTLGDFSTWISQQMGPSNAPLAWMDHLYATEGYRRLSTMNISLETGVQKVVVYGVNTKSGYVTDILHAEKQDRDGTWSSKLGDGPLIEYARFNELAGPDYGHPIAVYARPMPLLK